jgi:hypothetical protein
MATKAGLEPGCAAQSLINVDTFARGAELVLNHRDVLVAVVAHIELLAFVVPVQHAHLDHVLLLVRLTWRTFYSNQIQLRSGLPKLL